MPVELSVRTAALSQRRKVCGGGWAAALLGGLGFLVAATVLSYLGIVVIGPIIGRRKARSQP